MDYSQESSTIKQYELFIPSIDICLLILVVMTLALAAMRYSTKGSGETTYAQIEYTGNRLGTLDPPHPPFTAVIIKPGSIETCVIVDGSSRDCRSYDSIPKFKNAVKKDEIYVIYEESRSELLDPIMRGMIEVGVNTVHIARLEELK